jgi:hypothetical protein
MIQELENDPWRREIKEFWKIKREGRAGGVQQIWPRVHSKGVPL